VYQAGREEEIEDCEVLEVPAPVLAPVQVSEPAPLAVSDAALFAVELDPASAFWGEPNGSGITLYSKRDYHRREGLSQKANRRYQSSFGWGHYHRLHANRYSRKEYFDRRAKAIVDAALAAPYGNGVAYGRRTRHCLQSSYERMVLHRCCEESGLGHETVEVAGRGGGGGVGGGVQTQRMVEVFRLPTGLVAHGQRMLLGALAPV
jgi:hypothetical protein